jgi:ligand-binding sensor domain-containing protein
MKKYYLHKQICSLLLLFFFIPCYGQTGGYMFHGAIRDKVGNLWFAATGAGVYRCDAATGELTNLTEKDGLCANNVSSIYEDKSGTLWFSTEHGICRYDGKSFTDFTKKEGSCPFDAGLLLEDRNGNFWFSTNGYGVCRYNPATGVFTNFTKEQGLGSNTVQCALEDKAGNLWFGERAGGVSRYDSTSGRFSKVNGEGCFSDQIMSIIEDKMGNIWFANLYYGVCRYDVSRANHPCNKNTCKHDLRIQQDLKEHNEELAKSFTHFTEENGLCNDTITCIYEDKKGNLWFGSDVSAWRGGRGGGCRYDGKSFTYFSTKEGLGNMGVWTIVEDNEGNIWVGGRGGLFRYHSPSGKFINYTYKVKKQ